MDMDLSSRSTSQYWSRARAMKAKLSDDLTNGASWKVSPLMFPSLGIQTVNFNYPADYSIIFTPGKTYPAFMSYNYNQIDLWQAYANIKNELELYYSIPLY